MLRRIAGCALFAGALALLVAGVAVWLLWAPEPEVPRLQGALRKATLQAGGRERSFAFYVPPKLRANPPLVLVLHGSMMNGAQMRAAIGYAFDQLADRDGFLVAYPDGYHEHWNDCRAAGDYDAKRLRIDDVAFLRALTEWFRRRHEIGDLFATGVSNGAQMSYRLALEAPDLVRGIGAIAANLPAPGNQTCTPSSRPVATMIVNGTDDPLNPHEGGPVALYGLFLRRGNVLSTRATAEYWARLAGHRSAPSIAQLPDRDPSDGTSATGHEWTAAGKPPVALLLVNGGGHTIPHPQIRSRRLLGRTSHDLSAAEEIWEFFESSGARVRAHAAETAGAGR